MHWEGSAIGDGIGIEGVIISSADLNNLTSQKGAYIQDATGGLQLRFTTNHDFKFGDKVKINLSGAKKGAYNKAVQVEVDNSMAVRVSSGETVTPKTVSVADFLANKYEGQYVAVENVQVNIQDLSKTWVVAGAHTSINIDEKNGSKFIVFSSKYSKFGSETVPQGSVHSRVSQRGTMTTSSLYSLRIQTMPALPAHVSAMTNCSLSLRLN